LLCVCELVLELSDIHAVDIVTKDWMVLKHVGVCIGTVTSLRFKPVIRGERWLCVKMIKSGFDGNPLEADGDVSRAVLGST
jgi:hypothetical protein